MHDGTRQYLQRARKRMVHQRVILQDELQLEEQKLAEMRAELVGLNQTIRELDEDLAEGSSLVMQHWPRSDQREARGLPIPTILTKGKLIL